MIGTAPPRRSVRAKVSAASKAARIQTDSEHADDRRRPAEAGLDQALAAAHGADDVVRRRPYPVEPELGQ